MGNLHLVTGYAGRTHVTAADMASLFEALIRSGQFVMAAGANFAATVVSNNQIRISDGELLMQGRHVKLDPGAYVDLTIDNGAQGYLRNDLIVARYTKNAENGVESCDLVVLKGTAATSGPADPEYSTGSINAGGDIQHDFPLYRVPLSGLNVGELVALFEPQASLFEGLLAANAVAAAANTAAAAAQTAAAGARSAADAASTAAAAAQATANSANTTAKAAMPKAGGTFTGKVAAQSVTAADTRLRNCYVENNAGTMVSSMQIWFKRK